jgi:hypothetical protein
MAVGGEKGLNDLASIEASSRLEPVGKDTERRPVHYALDEGVVDFAGMKFACAVIDGEIRVISGTEFMRVMGIYRSGALSTRRSSGGGDVHIPLHLAHKNLQPFIFADEKLVDALRNPIRYRVQGRAVAEGIPGTVLRRILTVWTRAQDAGVLGPSQMIVATRARALLDALADLAIDALIDEATGYQKRRAHDSLQRLLQAYVLPEFRGYQTRFPISFYEEIHRVMGWPFDASSSARTAYIGKLTNKLIYEKLPAGVVEELRSKNPVDPETKRRKKKHFQFLTEEVGDPHLKQQITAVIALLRATPDGQWKFFEMLFNQAFKPKQGELFFSDEIINLSKRNA